MQERTRRVPEHRGAARHHALERASVEQRAVLRCRVGQPAVAGAGEQRGGGRIPPQRSVETRAGQCLRNFESAVAGVAPVGLQAGCGGDEELTAVGVERQGIRRRQAQHAPGRIDLAVANPPKVAQPCRRPIPVPRQRIGAGHVAAADANGVARAGFGAQRRIRRDSDLAAVGGLFETGHAVADDAVHGQGAGASRAGLASQGEAEPRRSRRFPNPPCGRIAEHAGALAAFHRGELVGAAHGAGGAGKGAGAGEMVVAGRLAPGEAKSRHAVRRILERAVDGQARGQQIGLAGARRERHPGGRSIVAAARRQGQVRSGFAGEDAKPQRDPLGIHLPSEIAVHGCGPAPPGSACSRRRRFAWFHRHRAEIDLRGMEGGRRRRQRLGGCHVVVGEEGPRLGRPIQNEVAARLEGVLGGDHDAVFQSFARGERHRLPRQAGNQAQVVDAVADERRDAEPAAVHAERPVAGGRRRPAMPCSGREAIQRLAALRRCAEIAAARRTARPVEARGELEIVVARAAGGAPGKRQRHHHAAAVLSLIAGEDDRTEGVHGRQQVGGEDAQADAVVPAALRLERRAAARSAVEAGQRCQRVASARLEDVQLNLVGEIVERARRDAEAEYAGSRRRPRIPDGARSNALLRSQERLQPVVDQAARVGRLARLRRGQQQVELRSASFPAQHGCSGEVVVGRDVRHRRRRGIGLPDRDCHRSRSGACVPCRRGEVQVQVLRFFGTSEQQPHGLFLASGDFADGDAVAALPGQGALQVVLAGSAAAPRQDLLDARAAVRQAGRVVGAAAIDAQHRAGRDVAVCGDGQIDGERCAGGRGHALLGDGNGKPRRRRAADDRPRQPGARRLHPRVLRHHLQAIEAGDRIAQDEPLDVVAAGSRGRVAACRGLRLGAIGVPVHPQVQIVQHRLRQRIRRWLVPGQRDV